MRRTIAAAAAGLLGAAVALEEQKAVFKKLKMSWGQSAEEVFLVYKPAGTCEAEAVSEAPSVLSLCDELTLLLREDVTSVSCKDMKDSFSLKDGKKTGFRECSLAKRHGDHAWDRLFSSEASPTIDWSKWVVEVDEDAPDPYEDVSSVKKLSESHLRELLDDGAKVFADVRFPWCHTCDHVADNLNKIAPQMSAATFGWIDALEHRQLAVDLDLECQRTCDVLALPSMKRLSPPAMNDDVKEYARLMYPPLATIKTLALAKEKAPSVVFVSKTPNQAPTEFVTAANALWTNEINFLVVDENAEDFEEVAPRTSSVVAFSKDGYLTSHDAAKHGKNMTRFAEFATTELIAPIQRDFDEGVTLKALGVVPELRLYSNDTHLKDEVFVDVALNMRGVVHANARLNTSTLEVGQLAPVVWALSINGALTQQQNPQGAPPAKNVIYVDTACRDAACVETWARAVLDAEEKNSTELKASFRRGFRSAAPTNMTDAKTVAATYENCETVVAATLNEFVANHSTDELLLYVFASHDEPTRTTQIMFERLAGVFQGTELHPTVYEAGLNELDVATLFPGDEAIAADEAQAKGIWVWQKDGAKKRYDPKPNKKGKKPKMTLKSLTNWAKRDAATLSPASIALVTQRLDEDASNEAQQKADEEALDKEIAAMSPDHVTEEGVEVRVYQKGDPEDGVIEDGDQAEVHYVGIQLETNKMFDNSRRRNKPLPFFKVGSKKVIPCWDAAMLVLRKGDRARLFCPASQAYGDRESMGFGKKGPPSGDLQFDVEVLDVKRKDPDAPKEKILEPIDTKPGQPKMQLKLEL